VESIYALFLHCFLLNDYQSTEGVNYIVFYIVACWQCDSGCLIGHLSFHGNAVSIEGKHVFTEHGDEGRKKWYDQYNLPTKRKPCAAIVLSSSTVHMQWCMLVQQIILKSRARHE